MQNFQVVDISAWQEKLNWQKLKANNIQGVIIKIGEYTYLDEMFISHVNNAVTYNLPMAYIIMLMLQQLMKL